MAPGIPHFSRTHASTRISLRWLPEAPFENTDTLVLTVGDWYVDLRVDKQSGHLDWAIAGQCLLQDTNPRRIVFTHTIDSHNNFNVSDPCPFLALPNGDDLETGTMARPDVPGTPMTPYEEVWRFLPVLGDSMESGSRVAWILESEDVVEQDDQVKTFLAHIGGRYLALQQSQAYKKGPSSSDSLADQIWGGQVSARSEEWSGACWKVKYCLGQDGVHLPSISKHIDLDHQSTWQVPGQKATVKGRQYIIRALEKSDPKGTWTKL
ncbi:uncharacterized protein N7459_001015 [Penicillium hispanicum]|uniref:uncharacterized protein n=1 Tax=Penicillium hispanicum TaxID=1080232 RepID=UPI0025419211|nr:uncharacterized protein N7459_001015 [Penicillium hispanicum]KAJ5594807.1 hypothetical protein N7459_001015 [Penicillium hispanicum]